MFNEKCRSNEDQGSEDLNKSGVLRHLQDLASTLGKINAKLSRVFEYHAAMGIDLDQASPVAAVTSTAADSNKQQMLQQKDMVPLRTVYTSLFSTGLHLQNSLLKVRSVKCDDCFGMIKLPLSGISYIYFYATGCHIYLAP